MFWKIFFVFNVIIISGTIVTEFIYPEYADFSWMSIIQYLSNIVGVIALYGLAFKRVILNKNAWQIAVPAILIVDIVYPAIAIYSERNEIFSDLSVGISFPVVFAFAFGAIYMVIYFIGLIKYLLYVRENDKNHITKVST